VSVVQADLVLAAEVAIGALFLGGLATYWMIAIRGAARHERAVLRERSRASRAHYAAVEAAEDDPIFSPDSIEASVKEIVALAGDLWRSERIDDLDRRPDSRLIRAWAQSWQSRLGKGLEAVGSPSTDLLRVVNRDDEQEDGVVVRVRLRIHCKQPVVGALGQHHAHADERWTFGRSDGDWFLLSVGGDPLAGPILTAPLIPTPSSDTERMSEKSLVDMATSQKPEDGTHFGDLVSADAPPAFALLDLSVVDSRFLPALIAAELAHLVEAWEAAVTGPEAPLEQLASDDARAALLYPGTSARLVVRDAVLKAWEPTELHLTRHPPTIETTVDVEAVRYVAGDDGTHLAGNMTDPRRIKLTWTLELTESAEVPWRLVSSSDPAAAIAGWP
jgi:hypothetical protein